MTVKVTTCPVRLIRPALELLYRRLPIAQRAAQISAGERELSQESLVVATRAEQVIGVVVAQTSPGRIGWIWPPVVDLAAENSSEPIKVSTLLVRVGIQHLVSAGNKLAQALTVPGSSEEVVLEAGGMRRLTEMIRMQKRFGGGNNLNSPRSPEIQLYELSLRDELRLVLTKSYQGSLDFPELDGVRTVDEVLEGYAGYGTFRPEFWMLARKAGKCIGCVLFSHFAEENHCEIQYLGVIPEARRKGIGRALSERALHVSARVGADYLGLSVDVRNQPAIRLYKSLGFQEMDRRSVFIRKLSA